jgi:pimeloyl-ACP methyl ester carboxylesterase
VLLLHGFPDNCRSMIPLGRHLAAAGYHVVAPAMRGYWPSDAPTNQDYSLRALAADVHGLIRALSDGPAVVVGHDWGAAAAYAAAANYPQSLTACVAMSTPPNPVLPAGLLRVPRQVLASAYMGEMAWRNAVEEELLADNGALIERIWRRWSPEWEPDRARLDDVIRTFQKGTTARSARLYYRDILPFPRVRKWLKSTWEPTRAPIRVPTLIFAGDQDRCMLPALYDNCLQHIDAPAELVMLKGVGHFIPLEAPDQVASMILSFLSRL